MVEMMVEVVEMMIKLFPTYFPSFHFLFLSFFDFSPSSFLLLLFFLKNIRKKDIRIWRSLGFFEESME